MNKEICYIGIDFENIEHIKIPTQYFGHFGLKDISLSIFGTGKHSLSRHYNAKSAMFTLEPEANRDGRTFDGDVHSIEHENGTLFERLQVRDIVSVQLIYADGTKEEISVPWEDEDDNEFKNKLQQVTINANGSLCIIINDGTRI